MTESRRKAFWAAARPAVFFALALGIGGGWFLFSFSRGIDQFMFDQTETMRASVDREAGASLRAGDAFGASESRTRLQELFDRIQHLPGVIRVALMDASGNVVLATSGLNVGVRMSDPFVARAAQGQSTFSILSPQESQLFGADRAARTVFPLHFQQQQIGIVELYADVSRLAAFANTIRWWVAVGTFAFAFWFFFLMAITFGEYRRRLAAQEHAIRTTARDEALLRSMGEAVVAVDERGMVAYVNDHACALAGCRTESIVGESAFNAFRIVRTDNAPLDAAVHPITRALKTREEARYGLSDKLFLAHPERPVPITLIVTPFHAEGEIAGAVLVIRDATSEYDTDRAKSEFVSLASHQLRTPLTSIRWNAELLRTDGETALNVEESSYIAAIEANAERMSRLVRALLNVSRLDLGTFSIDPQRLLLGALARTAAEELAPLCRERRISIDTELPQDDAYVGDPNLISILFQNLFSNAVKYGKEGSIVRCAIKKDGKHLTISVQDHGIGIPRSCQEKIFTKLFRADNARAQDADGNGLGLYLVKGIVEQAGGNVSFVSEEGRGTTFTIRLPVGGMKAKQGTKALT